MNRPLNVGLFGYGRAGTAVARAIDADPEVNLRWIVKRVPPSEIQRAAAPAPLYALADIAPAALLTHEPVDVIIDFAGCPAVHAYGAAAADRGIAIVAAISDYGDEEKALLAAYARRTVVLMSPNITLGINYLLVASELLQHIAPFTDIEIIEEHFRDKREVSGTALRIAAKLGLDESKVNSIRVGGIVGHHEVVFGFPFQTVRLVHESISREAFGTGALFVAKRLRGRQPGMYRYDELIRETMLAALQPKPKTSGAALPARAR